MMLTFFVGPVTPCQGNFTTRWLVDLFDYTLMTRIVHSHAHRLFIEREKARKIFLSSSLVRDLKVQIQCIVSI